jgi:ORF6N domain-containing protein
MKSKTYTMKKTIIQPDFLAFIFHFRGKKVMVDADLAVFYEVPTKRLKEQVKRNIARFPEDFMFELSNEEKEELVANCDRLNKLKHASVNPIVFTEQGVAMLSSVLRSEKAIQINIEIMRAFSQYRALIRENEELRMEVKQLENKLNEAFRFLLSKIDALHQSNQERKPIGFKVKK